MNAKPLFAASLIALALTSCSHSRPAPVPRPEGYPRLQLYPAAYHSIRIGAMELQVNDSVRVELTDTAAGWFNLRYPAYDITVACTLSPIHSATQLTQVLANRTERLNRNLGQARAAAVQVPPRNALLLKAPAATLTPLQFLVTDSASYVLSGVAMMTCEVNPDSVAPVVNAVESDIIHLLQQL